MPAWNTAASKTGDVCEWLDAVIDSAAECIHIDCQAIINLDDGFIQKLYLVDKEGEALPSGLILGGRDAATKRNLAESMASRPAAESRSDIALGSHTDPAAPSRVP